MIHAVGTSTDKPDKEHDERIVLFKLGKSVLETFLVDTGTQSNIMSEATFRTIMKESPETINELCMTHAQQFHAYGGHRLVTLCSFKAWVEVANADKPKKFAKFVVIKNSDQNLMGYQTSKLMKIADVGLSVNCIQTTEDRDRIELNVPHPQELPLTQKAQKQTEFPKMPGVLVKFNINKDISPVKIVRRNIPLFLKDKVNDKLNSMLQRGIIERAPRASKWISPMHVVPKASHDIRIVIDVRQPNKAIIRHNHAMPVIDEVWDKLQGARYFSKYDLKDAFHHIEIDEESRELTTFMSDIGMMRYTRLAFGISCAPEIFQMEMERVLDDCKDFCIIFLDDILTYAETKGELLTRQAKIEKALKRNNLTINEEKTVKNATEIEFLGFHIKDGKLKPTDSKIEAIKNFEKPKMLKDLRSFLGLVNYIQSFIPTLAHLTEPLKEILRGKNGKAFWGPKQDVAFEEIKEIIAQELLPRHIFETNLPTMIFTDASPYALGAVLVQQKELNGKKIERVIACASKTLTDVERRYSQTQREALAAVWGVERFFYYLMGRKFTLRTDANALRFIYKCSPQESKRVLNRADGWALRLEPYDFDVQYVKGERNIADSFSRLCKKETAPKAFENDHEPHVLCYVSPDITAIQNYENNLQITIKDLEIEADKCNELSALRKALLTGEWEAELDCYKPFELDYTVRDKLIWRHGNLILPGNLRKQVLAAAHEFHATFSCMQHIVSQKFWWPQMDWDITAFIGSCKICHDNGCTRDLAHDSIMLITNEANEDFSESISLREVINAQNQDPEVVQLRESLTAKKPQDIEKLKSKYSKFANNLYISGGTIMHREQFLVPEILKRKVMSTAHKAHPGRNTMTAAIARYLWWPTLQKDVEDYVRTCAACTRTGRPGAPEPIVSTKLPSEPWQQIAIDFFSAPLDLKAKILVIKDYHSRFLITKLVKSEAAEETISALSDVFSLFGRPKQMKADNGPPFQSKDFAEWCESKGIHLIHSSPLSPRQNGLVERAMQGIKKALSIAKISGENYNKALNQYVTAYNSWPHAVTLTPPADLMFARAVRGNFPISDAAGVIDATAEDIIDRDRIAKTKSKLYQDRVLQAKFRTFEINDEVYMLTKGTTKLCPRYGETKFKVLGKAGSQLTLQKPNGDIILRSVEHVTKIVTTKDLEEAQRSKAKTSIEGARDSREQNNIILFKDNELQGILDSEKSM